MKLNLELVPASCFYKNVRLILTAAQWSVISKQVRSQAYDICQICQSNSQLPLDCHEVWEYNDDEQIQKLTGMIALCKKCHQVKHFGLARVQGKEERALSHLMRVNQIKRSEAIKYINQVFTQWAERSTKKWKLDISYLSEYGIDINKIEERK